jgi:gliding motility-associated-like protein
MKKYLIIFLVLFFNIKPLYRMFSQNCPYIGPDIQLPCGVNSTQLTADFSQCTGGGSSPLATTAYLNSQIPYVAQTNTGTSLTMTDDSQQGPFNIGFSFCFYGNTYTQFYVGSNGWISFSPNQPTSYTSAPVPNASNPVNSVMAAWQDWHPGLGGQVRYQLQGTAPCRKLVVSWINVPFYNCTTVTGTFHIVLYESTNVVEVHTQNKQFCSWANGTAVQGIQNSNGTQAVTTPGRNSTQWTAQNDGRRWTPNGAPVTATPTWYQVGNPVAIGTGLTITVTPPPVGAYYTCRMEYPSCFAGWSSCNNSPGSSGPDTIFVVPGPPSLPQPQVQINNPSCATLCDGSIIVTPVGGLSPYIFTWLTGQSGPNINNLCQGSYQVQISDAQGCSVISNPIQLIDPPVPTLTPIVSSDTVCSYSTSQLFSVVNTTGWNYQWSSDGTILSGNGTSQIDVDFSQLLPNSQYTTSVAGFNQNGCPTPIVSYSTFLYQVIPQITPIGPFCDYDGCQTLTAIPLGGQFSGSSVVNSEFCPQLSQTQTNLVTYDFIQSGCQFSDVVSILVNQRPIIEEVNPDNGVFEICDGVDSAIVTLQVVSNPSSTANYWIINSDTVESNSLLGNFAEGVTYISVISEINGCLSLPETTSVNVIRCPQTIYYVPNSFTPDGDEHNQTFGVVFTSGFNPTEFQIQIFNRWGELIWESYDHQFKWDGTYDGRVVQAGIYTWKIKFGNADDDGFNLISGHLNILR